MTDSRADLRPDLRVALIGAGLIGRAHVVGAAAAPGIRVTCIADPGPAGKALAGEYGLAWYPDHMTLLDRERPDAAVVATPNVLHVPVALDCIARSIPVLVEKPIADTVADARRLTGAAQAAGVPLMVGHHRRHNPIIRRAKRLISDGTLGTLVSATVMALLLKPDDYFNVTWRRQAGGGPVLINLIHEIDLLRHLCGEIASVQAITSNAVRGFAVEDTAAVVLRFVNGALGTISLSDTAVAPWSWDLSSGESVGFRGAPIESHFICGTQASVTLPQLNVWHYAGKRGWDQPLDSRRIGIAPEYPYQEQMRHFAAVIRGEETPVVSGPDATRTLEATLAVHQAATTRQPVTLS